MATYLAVKYLTEIQGDCVRSALIVNTGYLLLYVLLLAGFGLRFHTSRDPFFIKTEVIVIFLVSSPLIVCLILYSIVPN